MAERVDTLIEHCSQAVLTGPSSAGDGIVEDATVAIDGGKIVAVGPARELEGRFRATSHIDATGRLLTPGFVDSHTHLVFAGDRSGEFAQRCAGASYEEIAAAGGGIRASVRATRQASEDELFDTAFARAVRMLSLGTTTIEIKSGYGLDEETELRQLRVAKRIAEKLPVRVVSTYLGAHEVPDEYRSDRNGYLDLVCETVMPKVVEEGLAQFCDVFCEENVFTQEESTRVLEKGAALGLRPKVHADELARSGGSQVAAKINAISADHLMKINDEDVEALREAGVVPTLLPGTTFYLGKNDYAPARKLLNAGLPVALATDRNPGSCTVESLGFIVGLSCLRMGMTPIEALRGATENGALALGLQATCGRIDPGRSADLVLWDAPHLGRIVYEFECVLSRTVFVAGQPAFDAVQRS